jgi:hypothetical protein
VLASSADFEHFSAMLRSAALVFALVLATTAGCSNGEEDVTVPEDSGGLDTSVDVSVDSGADPDSGTDTTVVDSGTDTTIVDSGADTTVVDSGADTTVTETPADTTMMVDTAEAAVDSAPETAPDTEPVDTGSPDTAPTCTTAADCPGADAVCERRACVAGRCTMEALPTGTATPDQVPGDCRKNTCDGTAVAVSYDPTDVPDDRNECTTDICSGLTPTFLPKAGGSPCTTGGGTMCDGAGNCGECFMPSTCPGKDTKCRVRTCTAGKCGFMELGDPSMPCIECTMTSECAPGESCIDTRCVLACSNGTKEANESDIDCGGTSDCARCGDGKTCAADSDCISNNCFKPATVGKCLPNHLLISEIQTRGTNGGNDEFIEIYNPTNASVTFDSTWTIAARSAVGTNCATLTQGTRYTGTGSVIPPGGHLLLTNNGSSGYDGAMTGNGTYSTGVTDGSSVVLYKGSTVVDAMCFFFGSTTGQTYTNLTNTSCAYICEGMPITNNHDNGTGTNFDRSLERKPGGLAAGNFTDTGSTAADFSAIGASNPQNLSSAATP